MYSVEYVSGLNYDGIIVNSKTDYSNQSIQLLIDQTEDSLQTSFLMEVIRIAMVWAGLMNRDIYEEEDVVRDLSTHLLQIFEDNKKIFPTIKVADSVKVGPFIYTYSEETVLEHQGNLAWGLTSPAEQTIEVIRDGSVMLKRMIFLHELMHAIFDVSNLNTRLDRLDLAEIAQDISVFLLMVIQDNKWSQPAPKK